MTVWMDFFYQLSFQPVNVLYSKVSFLNRVYVPLTTARMTGCIVPLRE